MLVNSYLQNGGAGDLDGADHESAYQRVKHWMEKRLASRQKMNASVLVLQGTRVQSGILTDLSDTGFGLNKVHGLTANEFVSVSTSDGLILDGRVVWIEGARTGVSLPRQI